MAAWDEPIETGDVPDSDAFDAIVVGGGPEGSQRDAVWLEKRSAHREKGVARQNMR